jgi:ketosteroid isomerase-like protein
MSQENVEIVRRVFEHFRRTGEWDFSRIDPEAEFDNSNAMIDRAVYRGHDGLQEYLSLMQGMWTAMRLDPEEFIAVGEDQVVVPFRMVMVGREEIETVARAATVYTLAEGKITHMKAFQSKADALEATGLSE